MLSDDKHTHPPSVDSASSKRNTLRWVMEDGLGNSTEFSSDSRPGSHSQMEVDKNTFLLSTTPSTNLLTPSPRSSSSPSPRFPSQSPRFTTSPRSPSTSPRYLSIKSSPRNDQRSSPRNDRSPRFTTQPSEQQNCSPRFPQSSHETTLRFSTSMNETPKFPQHIDPNAARFNTPESPQVFLQIRPMEVDPQVLPRVDPLFHQNNAHHSQPSNNFLKIPRLNVPSASTELPPIDIQLRRNIEYDDVVLRPLYLP